MTDHKSHKEYTVDCPECQRELAEFWAKELGWRYESPDYSSPAQCKEGDVWKKYGEVEVLDENLVDIILSPEGMLKAWEYAESKGWLINMRSRVRFDRDDNHHAGTNFYDPKKYGKVLAILLAAREAVEVNNET